MSMIDHIRRSMKGEPSPPKLNEIKVFGEKPIAIAPQPVSSIDAKIKALIESKKQQMNEIMEAPLGKETTGAPVPSMDNFSVKGKGKPKMVNGNGNAQPPEVDGQEQVELGGITPVDLKPETKDITTKDLRKEGLASYLSAPFKASGTIQSAPKAKSGKTVGGGLKAAGKFVGKRIGSFVAGELGKQVGISGSTITGTISALASGGKKAAKAIKAGKAAKSTTDTSAEQPKTKANTKANPMSADAKANPTSADAKANPMSSGKAKSKKPATVKGAVAGGGEPEKMTPDQYRKEQGLAPRGKAKPGTAPESSTSKGATLMSKDSLFKQKSTNNDNEKPAQQPKKHTDMHASPGEYGKKLNREFPIPPRQPQKSNNPMSAKSKTSSGSTNRISSNLKNRMMSSTASASTASSPMSAKPSSMSAKMSSGVSSLDKFKTANRMKIKKINEELLELVRLIESQNRFNQPPAMGDYSAEEHLDKMVHHHNKGLEAQAAGDKTKARVHFLTRNHHFAWYHRKAPEDQSGNLDLPKIRAMLDVREDITPLDKVMEIRRRLIAA